MAGDDNEDLTVEPMPDKPVVEKQSTLAEAPYPRQDPHADAASRRAFLLAAGVSATAALAAATMESGIATIARAEATEGERPAMRSPHKQNTELADAALALPPLAVIAHNRMGFGPRKGDLAAFQSLGNTDSDRLRAYVDQQLAPDWIDDADCDARLAAEGLTTLDKSLGKLWADHFIGGAGHYLPVEEVERATLIRAIYSKRQLVEVLADYWHNHFNVYAWDYWIGPTFVHYDRDVIRKHLLGNFRRMLGAVAKSPAMIFYLDNQSNSGDRPNENFAREQFELHAMGAENYFGVRDPNDPGLYDANGNRIAYVDADVYGSTTCFTGWRVDTDTGEFFFDESKHFPYQKLVLGKIIPEFGGIQDGETVLDMLADHRGTARYVCRRLCRRLIGDEPPDRIVAEAADVFHSTRNAPDQLKQVVRTILLSPEFASTWGQKIKRPNEYIFGIARTSDMDVQANYDLVHNYRNAGQSLFRWAPPNGYPDDRAAWSSTMPMLQRWRRCSWMMEWKRGGDGPDQDVYRFLPLEQMPQSKKTPNDIVNFWIGRILGSPIPEVERQAIAEFMAYGRNPDFDLPDVDIAERLRYMIALIYMSPSFQWR